MRSDTVFVPLMFATLAAILATTSATEEIGGREFDAIRLRGHAARSDTSLSSSSIVVSSSDATLRRTKKNDKKKNEKIRYNNNKSERTAENPDVEDKKDGGTTTITTAPNMDGAQNNMNDEEQCSGQGLSSYAKGSEWPPVSHYCIKKSD